MEQAKEKALQQDTESSLVCAQNTELWKSGTGSVNAGASRLQTAVTIKRVTKNMAQVAKALDKGPEYHGPAQDLCCDGRFQQQGRLWTCTHW